MKHQGFLSTSDKPHYENVPFEVPSSWVWSTVNEINMYNSKNVDPAKQKENTFELYSVPIFPTNTPEIIKGEKIGSAKQSVENGDVLLCKINPKINRVWFVKNRTENTMIASSEWIVIRNKFMLTDYLVFCFMSPYFRDLMENNVSGVGGSLTRAQPSMVANYAIPIPPLQEQKRIIIEIKHWFELIDVIDQSKECLQGTIKKAKSKILDLAIHGKLVHQNPVDEPAADLLKRINPKAEITCYNGHYQKLPEGWCLTTLGNIGNWQSGATPSRLQKEYYGGNIPWLKTGDLNDGIITNIPEFITEKALAETSVKLNPSGSVLIAMYGATIGKVGVLSFPATTNQACCACVDYKLEQMYLFYFLLANRENFIRMGGGGAQPNISKEKIINTVISLPPLKEQHRIVAKIEEIFAQLDTIEASL